MVIKAFDAEQLEKLLIQAEFEPAIFRERIKWFLYFSKCNSVSKTCKEYGIARTTFYRWAKRFDPENLSTLLDRPKKRIESENPDETIESLEKEKAFNVDLIKDRKLNKLHSFSLLINSFLIILLLCVISFGSGRMAQGGKLFVSEESDPPVVIYCKDVIRSGSVDDRETDGCRSLLEAYQDQAFKRKLSKAMQLCNMSFEKESFDKVKSQKGFVCNATLSTQLWGGTKVQMNIPISLSP